MKAWRREGRVTNVGRCRRAMRGLTVLTAATVALGVIQVAIADPPNPLHGPTWDALSDRLRHRIERNRSQRTGAAEEAWMAQLPADILHQANVPYAGPTEDNPRLTSLDVFWSAGETAARPVIIFVHGGGMSAGDKSPAVLVENKARYFPAHGFVFVSMNYRLAPEVAHTVAVRDVATGIGFVRAHAKTWGGDPDALFVIGHSAGAQLVMEVLTDSALRKELDLPRRSISGAVIIDTQLYDIPFAIEHPDDDGWQREIVEMTYGKSPASWAAASPINRIGDAGGLPPLLLFHAVNPASLSYRAAWRFSERLRLAGGRVSMQSAREKDHSHLGRDLGNDGDWITESVMQFLRQSLAGEP